MSLLIELRGGLGNQLFQLAAGESVAASHQRILILEKPPSADLLSSWSHLHRSHPATHCIEEDSMAFQDWSTIQPVRDVKILGYFQDWRYISQGFVQRVRRAFSNTILSKYPDIQSTVFIHIRGGDYKGHVLHGVDLTRYYANAMALFPEDTVYSIFTNDVEYAKSFNLPGSIIEENESDSLFLMSQCKGGICANSTFSWWGAYLNTDRMLTLPDTWFLMPGFNAEGLYFPKSLRISIA